MSLLLIYEGRAGVRHKGVASAPHGHLVGLGSRVFRLRNGERKAEGDCNYGDDGVSKNLHYLSPQKVSYG